MKSLKALTILCFFQLILMVTGCFPTGKIVNSNGITPQNGSMAAEKFKKGRGYYLRECGQCHPHVQPSERTRDEWRRILARKKNKVSLTNSQFAKLKEYILAESRP